jgi:regulatory protein
MARITALHRNKGRMNIFLDGEFAFSLSVTLVSREGLHNDQVISPEQVESLVKLDHYQRGLVTATRFLSLRPRSDSELRTRLQRGGFDTQTQDSVIEALKDKGLIDDSVFAQYWTENRESFSPRSRRLTRIELQKKGIDREVIEQVVNTIDDETSAYRAVSSRARNIRWPDRDQFRRRLGGYLERRGFGYGVIESTLKKIWKEIQIEVNSNTGEMEN